MNIRKENQMNKFLRFFLVAAFIPSSLAGCSRPGIQVQTVRRPMAYTVLKPGEKVSDMVITTGAENASPLWAFCSPTIENDHLITADCGELSYSELAIGHTFGVMDLIPHQSEWEELNWHLAVDGWTIDLEAFGTYAFVHPDLASSPSPVREVFRSIRVWDVVLVHPTPGVHKLQGQARSEEGTYAWVVNFTVTAIDN
jgi:hypothetical protein